MCVCKYIAFIWSLSKSISWVVYFMLYFIPDYTCLVLAKHFFIHIMKYIRNYKQYKT